jgi:2-polyprenyl-3-methyl-5-hydroxy-6-metoxy-1,4-benzoquinol methylase
VPVRSSHCAACGGTAIVKKRPRIEFGDAALWRCLTCGTEFLFPQPTDQRLGEIYSDDYYAPWHLETPQQLTRMKQMSFRSILAEVGETDATTVLDLGCANGDLLSLVDRPNVQLFGVDLNSRAIDRARERLPDASFHAGTLADEPFPGTQFDVVTMVDFIEHVRDPEDELRRVAGRLSPTGRVIVSTPRVGSVVQRLTGRSWPQYREEHLTYLSLPGIETLFGRVGLEALSVRSTRKAITPAYVYRQALAYPLSVVTPIARFVYERLPARGLGPFRVWFGEMTVVARRDPTSLVASR